MEVVQQGDPYLCVVVGIGKYRDNTIQYEYHTCRRRWPEGEKAGIPNKPEFRRLHLLVAACFLPVNLLPASPSRSFRYHCYYYLPLLDLKGSTYCTPRTLLPSLPWPLHAPSHSCLPQLPPLPPKGKRASAVHALCQGTPAIRVISFLFLHPVIAFLIGLPPLYVSDPVDMHYHSPPFGQFSRPTRVSPDQSLCWNQSKWLVSSVQS